MKWAYYIKHKTKVVALLLLIIILILANNIYDRIKFSNLDESIASIYKDRLMPATYIFQLTDHIYQKRITNLTIIQDSAVDRPGKDQDKNISDIIKEYETTYLTAVEKEQWLAFRQALQQYNTLNNASVKNEAAINDSFNKTLQHLHALSRIQVDEGNRLFSGSRSNVSGMIIMSQLEIALLLILGILALVLVSINNNRLMRIQSPRMN